MSRPLNGLRVVELAGIGPSPHAAMMLADMGADVIRVERPTTASNAEGAPSLRGRRVVSLDLKRAAEVDLALRMITKADVLVEGFRPGVAERLGVGPTECLERNRGLVYGRMTGWGQDGPLAERAGHDINYISLTGVLHAIGRAHERPAPPLNVVGDFGGGSMLLVQGILAALLERDRTGNGQVVDAAMVDGVSLLASMFWDLRATGDWMDDRDANILDGGAPFYDTYTCADGRWVAVGALEPQFYSQLVQGLGLDPEVLPDRDDRDSWPRLREILARVFLQRPRDFWADHFEGRDACVTPVLAWSEVAQNAHMAARGTIALQAGIPCPSPAPRFSRSTPDAFRPVTTLDVDDLLAEWEA